MVYCERCNKHFPNHRSLRQHVTDSDNHHVCSDCNKDFPTWRGLKEHYVQSPQHYYCQFCNLHFYSEEQWYDHEEYMHYPCHSCGKIFYTAIGLHEHNRQKHWYCVDCRRLFQNESNLKSHLKSATHVFKTVCCPGAGCDRKFVSMAALVLHFESGTCPSGLNRAELNRLVVRMDRNNVITNPARLISGPDGYEPATVTRTWATERSWNGSAYECFLCHGSYRTLYALNAHLQSPRHQEKIYRCPNRTNCGMDFSALSALTQHVESGKCGVNRFKEVQNALDSLVSGVKRLTV